ncbi:hypothetical protein PMI09_02189 [Rhizobium sp. CF122]|uniref:hypothetical protein n=1 Tax=Rhizobium sp. CF122 TaxID=1144312 RepID=UPI000271D334|nr:hypothetical protein [Rhizobium sp. CF122]EJL54873.1 hypothetical protein PMI09_02189 [Rhizobium sp. CF122]
MSDELTVFAKELIVGVTVLLNFTAPYVAFRVHRHFGRRRVIWHSLAFLFVLISPLLAGGLIVPEMLPDEAPDVGDGLLLLPLLAASALILLTYCLAAVWLALKAAYSTIAFKISAR